jgi:two-component system cell cycle sensor histidine kinase/response regulator CckA
MNIKASTMLHIQKKSSSEADSCQPVSAEWFETAQDPIFVIDPSGMILEVNITFAEQFGMQCHECIGCNIYDLLSSFGMQEIAAHRRLMAENVLRSGIGASFEEVQDKKHVKLTIYPVRSSESGIIKLLVLVQDMTPSHEFEKKFRDIQFQWEFTLQKCHVGVWIFDTQSNTVLHTLEHDRFFGYDEPVMDWGFQRFLTHVIPEDQAMVDKLFSKMLAELDEWAIEYRIRRIDGEIRWLREAGVVERDDKGKALRVLSISSDITRVKDAEIAREEMEGQLRQSQKLEMVGQLAGGVAHDFNNMLMVILGHTEILLDQVDENHPFFDNLERIKQSVSRSSDMVRHMLAFARKQILTPKVIDIDKELDSIRPILGQMIRENIKIQWLLENRQSRVRIDPSQLLQIVTNLFINSRDSITADGTITISTETVHIKQSGCVSKNQYLNSGDFIRLSVSDTGCGIDKLTLPHIFEPFFTSKGTGKGTGLGLSTVYGIVKQNGGYIDCESEPEQGTTLTIYFPRHEESDTKEDDLEPELPAISEQATILVVEDEPDILKIIKKELELRDFNVRTARDAEEAVSIAGIYGNEISLLISDIILPNMNGIQLGQQLMEHNPDLKLLFMSGFTPDEIIYYGKRDERMSFIAKPFAIKDLVKIVDKMLSPAL